MEQEIKTVELMIALYCRDHHGSTDSLCPECRELFDYVKKRLEECPLKDNHGYETQSKLWKQFCSKLRDIICLFIKDNSANASYRQQVSLPSALRDCSTYKFQRTSFLKFEFHNKPTCSKCSIHCYKSNMREKIKAVMRYSGLRMLCRHPILTGRHYLINK